MYTYRLVAPLLALLLVLLGLFIASLWFGAENQSLVLHLISETSRLTKLRTSLTRLSTGGALRGRLRL